MRARPRLQNSAPVVVPAPRPLQRQAPTPARLASPLAADSHVPWNVQPRTRALSPAHPLAPPTHPPFRTPHPWWPTAHPQAPPAPPCPLREGHTRSIRTPYPPLGGPHPRKPSRNPARGAFTPSTRPNRPGSPLPAVLRLRRRQRLRPCIRRDHGLGRLRRIRIIILVR